MLTHAEPIVRAYVGEELFDKRRPSDNRLSLFATEGGTAVMCCYTFDSLMKNDLPAKGDRIALMVPVFTPYIEIPELDAYEFDVTYIEANRFAEAGVREWRYPEEEIAKREDPSIKLVCLVNPSNPPSLAPSSRVADLPRTTLLVYSYSKHYGATGWRLGVIGLHEDNDEMIADRRRSASRTSLPPCRRTTSPPTRCSVWPSRRRRRDEGAKKRPLPYVSAGQGAFSVWSLGESNP